MIVTIFHGEEIKRVFKCNRVEDAAIQLGSEEELIQGKYPPDKFFMSNGTPLARPSMPIAFNKAQNADGSYPLVADDTDIFRIDGILAGTNMVTPDGRHIENDGWYEFLVDYPGTYLINLELWPYKKEEIRVQAAS